MTQFETIIPLHTARLKFGEGATEELGYELKNLGARRVMLVVDPELWQFGLVDQLERVERRLAARRLFHVEVHVEPTELGQLAEPRGQAPAERR